MSTHNLHISSWIQAFRLRTLPLALSSIGLGGFLAASRGVFDISIFLFCCLTTILLQVLSNLANDYGDFVHGADHVKREGPQRMVQAGRIGLSQMKAALFLFTFLAFVSGVYLLYISFGLGQGFIVFLVIGIFAIIAAITYTSGHKPYGYLGLGDISVLLFFGPVGVLGTYYLQAKSFSPDLLLPALSCGLFSTAVLNLNNVRDIQSDEMAGKKSIPVRIGRNQAVLYHWLILFSGVLFSVIYTLLNYHSPIQFLFLLAIPLLVVNARAVKVYTIAKELDPYLKQMALTTLLFVVLFGIGNIINL